MARRRKSGSAAGVQMAMPSSGSDRMSTDISTAENGFIVNVSGETGGKKPTYFSKRFIASSRPQAMRIAASHFAGTTKGGRKAGRKKSAGKR